jgi:hypothetical protein
LRKQDDPFGVIDLNDVYRCRQLFSSIVQKSSPPSAKEQVFLEEAITKTYRAMVKSGINDILFAEQYYLWLAVDAAVANEFCAAGTGDAEEDNAFPKDWGAVIDFLEGRDWVALAKGGLKITGAIIALSLCIHDHDVSRGAAFAVVWYPFVDMLDGFDIIRKSKLPTSPESQDEPSGEPEPPIAPVWKT